MFVCFKKQSWWELLFPVQPNKHMVRHRLALRHQMMLANNHPFLHSQSALLDRLNQADWVFKTDQCIRVPRRDGAGYMPTRHSGTLQTRSTLTKQLNSSCQNSVKNTPLSSPGCLFQGCQDGDVSSTALLPQTTSPHVMLVAASWMHHHRGRSFPQPLLTLLPKVFRTLLTKN